MPEPIAYLNGRFLPQSEAGLSLHDTGFVMGVTVTDLCRTFRSQPFRLADHLARFRASCDAAGVAQTLTDERLTELVASLVAHNAKLLPADGDLAVVLFATPGPIGYYLGEAGGPGDGPATLGIHSFPLPFGRYQKLFTEGARLVIPETRHVPGESVDPRIKQRSRMHWWLADREARRLDPGASALLLDHDEWVTETAAANLLLVRDGVVFTPPHTSVLGGISLLVTRELCAEAGIPHQERHLTTDDCYAADEAMLTSTPYCLAGVRMIDRTLLNWPGPVFERLLAAWNGRVGLDLRRQILSNQ